MFKGTGNIALPIFMFLENPALKSHSIYRWKLFNANAFIAKLFADTEKYAKNQEI